VEYALDLLPVRASCKLNRATLALVPTPLTAKALVMEQPPMTAQALVVVIAPHVILLVNALPFVVMELLKWENNAMMAPTMVDLVIHAVQRASLFLNHRLVL